LSFTDVHAQLQPIQIEQLRKDVHRQLILLAAIPAKPIAVNFTEPPDKYIRSAREALNQADRYEPTAAAATVDWFCRMRVGEKDLPSMPAPQTATDHFLLGIAHFWVAQFADSQVGKMVLSSAPENEGLDLKNPGEAAIRHLRIACSMDPQQYWHHFTLAWALAEQGFKLLDSHVAAAEKNSSGKKKSGYSNPFALLTGGGPKRSNDLDEALTLLQGAESAVNSCITLRARFPRGYELRARALILQSLRHRKIEDALDDTSRDADADAPAGEADSNAQQLEARGIADFDWARNLAPNDPDVYWSRAHSLELLGRHAETVAAYRMAMQLDRPMGRMTGQQWVEFAQSYLSKITKSGEGQLLAEANGALALANLLLSQTEDSTRAAKHQAAALDAANRALDVVDSEACALSVRGTVYLQRGDSRAAIADFDEILNQDPANFMAAAGRAQALEQLKEFGNAKTAWGEGAEKSAVTDWQKEDVRLALERLKDKTH
jgi:tetratricopeptide (TPR) repeat protein